MDAAAGERVQVHRRNSGEGLTFTGPHFGDFAFVEDDAAHELHVVGALTDLAEGGLAGNGERLREDVVEVFALGEPFLELGGLREQVVVGEWSEFV